MIPPGPMPSSTFPGFVLNTVKSPKEPIFLFLYSDISFVLFFASIIGLIFVLPSILRTKKNLQTEIPFGPPIISAAILYFFKGEIIIGMIIKY